MSEQYQNVTIEQLYYSYSDTPFIHDLSFDFKAGELFNVVGPNGAGKTTLLYLLGGIIKPKAGQILLDGMPLSSFKRQALARIMTIIPAESNIAFDFTVYDIVSMGRYPYHSPLESLTGKDREIIGEAIEQTGLTKYEHKVFNRLSSGERQRVLIARALAQKTSILLMDEPTVHLDIHYQSDIYRLAKSLAHDKNLSVFMISHDLNYTSMYSDRIMLMHEGRIVKIGIPDDIFQQELLSNIYGTDLSVYPHPKTGKPTIWPD
ncbi:MAG: ABC transporter ATP-binding protein [Candidatus Scalindua rubra]|uniref:Cobalt ABC transporter ATP-binding component n=1 Tax=Candidatus Scalindua brodae TaxID=237368 RepID=A0A0B0EET6_9BACT|nr:MAG: cobalt ABC transporter ATP-binding component [Candidatus Scalindua brodae]MBZ0110662.1 ABC transporter ATP-binding protein [Candidatus Scalindua rubra]TWU28917.1 Iron(3+)-hydroxamate import ATP-binding protein FhuC [Candidatus Brocadiaceae bacterium S225]